MVAKYKKNPHDITVKLSYNDSHELSMMKLYMRQLLYLHWQSIIPIILQKIL